MENLIKEKNDKWKYLLFYSPVRCHCSIGFVLSIDWWFCLSVSFNFCCRSTNWERLEQRWFICSSISDISNSIAINSSVSTTEELKKGIRIKLKKNVFDLEFYSSICSNCSAALINSRSSNSSSSSSETRIQSIYILRRLYFNRTDNEMNLHSYGWIMYQ